MKALLIPDDGPPREIDLPDAGGTRFMPSVGKLIGSDCPERIWITTRWEAWLHENGFAAGKPVNEAATYLARAYGAEYAILGTVVIISLDDTGEPADLPPAQVDLIVGKPGHHRHDTRLVAQARNLRAAAQRVRTPSGTRHASPRGRLR